MAQMWSRHLRSRRRVPPLPSDAIVPLHATDDVLLRRSWSPWEFTPQTYAQESAFAQELAARGRLFAVSDRPDVIFDKSIAWFLPNHPVFPRVWDHSRQVREFAASLERQANRLFCSSEEMAYWENKVHMHEQLDRVGAPTPETKILTAVNWRSAAFDFEPVLIKEEHSFSSAGVHHFDTASGAERFVAGYPFRPGESLIMQELVRGATRDMRVTMVGNRAVSSATYWRIKSSEALSSDDWTTTATTYNSRVHHGDIPAFVAPFVARYLASLGVRVAGVDLIWVDDDVSRDPLILEFSPHFQPNPPKPARYANLTYKQFKQQWAAPDGYLECQYLVFRQIAAEILNQGLF